MGVFDFSIPKSLVLNIVNKVHFVNFIETGTYKGDTCFWAAKYFEKVYTIEISPEISKNTSSLPHTPTNIEFLIGDSKDLLAPLVNRIEGRAFFWLDGHWCIGAGGREEECPLLKELDAISNLKDAVILIDDARCFLGPLPEPHDHTHWPMIDDIFDKLRSHFPQNFVTIIDDVIVCVPSEVREVIYQYWRSTFKKRYYSQTDNKELLKKMSKKEIMRFIFNI